MSSINFEPSYLSTLTSNINIPPMRPAYLSSKPLIRPSPPTYQHLNQQIPRRPALYGAGQRKFNDYHRFQQGTTTTFNGYTNMTGHRNNNNNNFPPNTYPRHRQNYHYNNDNHNNHQYHHQHYNNNNDNMHNNNLPSLADENSYYPPSRHNARSHYHAQLYNPNHQRYSRSLSRSKYDALARLPSRSPSPYRRLPPPIKPRRHYPYNDNKVNDNVNHQQGRNHYYKPNDNVNVQRNDNVNAKQNDNVNSFQGLILSDSMCSRVRTNVIKKYNLVDVELSYESGCDSIKMLNWLNTPEARRIVRNKDFILI